VVQRILRLHTNHFAGEEVGVLDVIAEAIPWGALALKVCADYDLLMSSSQASHAFDLMRSRSGWYDPVILEAFAELQGRQRQEITVYEVSLKEIAAGMAFGEDVRSAKGLLLIAFGQEVTPSMLERIRNFSPTLGIREPIRMLVRQREVHRLIMDRGVEKAPIPVTH
jgi:hypothetical protein